jgi:hypothetical protein
MITTKHTYGPWIPSIHGFQVLTGDDQHSICELKSLPEMRENSRLIAAAPELLAALWILVDHAREKYPHFESPRGQADIALAIAAIDKAMGE